jgi:hypothetical protein
MRKQGEEGRGRRKGNKMGKGIEKAKGKGRQWKREGREEEKEILTFFVKKSECERGGGSWGRGG